MPYETPGTPFCPKRMRTLRGEKYRKTCLRFFKLMCATSLGKLLCLRSCHERHRRNECAEPGYSKSFSMSMAQPTRCGRRWKRKPGGICDEVCRNALWNVGAVCRFLSKAADRCLRWTLLRLWVQKEKCYLRTHICDMITMQTAERTPASGSSERVMNQ